MKSINCSEFDGNGFTIKNCFINEDDYYGSASFFTRGIKSVKNVTFENVEIKSTGGISAAVVVSGDCEKINNVRVNNCKPRATILPNPRVNAMLGVFTADTLPHIKTELLPNISAVTLQAVRLKIFQ